jgi:lysyl-tRNA synthetase class I
MFDYLWEVLMILLSVIGVLVLFVVKRLHDKVDKNTEDLVLHRIEDARNFVTRQEHEERILQLKEDLRTMISPIRVTVENIEKFLREGKEERH